jgi:prepilin-type N-terminal cleavage/methylation domain-containing protein
MMKFFRKNLNNQYGFSLIELMVASIIGLVALGGAIMVFTTQNNALKDENDGTKVRAKGRLAIKILAKEIRMAGYGLPPPSVTGEEFVADDTNKITFDTSKALDGTDATTFTTAEILENAPTITV